ncbi:putative membrane protein [Propionispora sp. 2/2-37]|uniref:glycoside hydrolase n=1 Tax=Propionispora sp. 2/2-37 TaxID=1677858 RepID=UPI0006BB6371|nr:glycoside hydrolase [Propionispora sp. 2/2-37]CUH97629.1 putative membrane protein [Propionispora sp. 2/2-37]
MIANEEYTARKDRKKVIRVILQIVILLAVAGICLAALFTLKQYSPYTVQNTRFSGDKGFIALAYFGVARNGDQNLIGVERLREHLQALKDLGYVTITQQDILDYYQSGKELPEKSLFLMFEDGRRDTAIFSQKILEELNYKATMLTYPEKFAKKDTKFLMPPELKDLEKSTFWEMGTNGYRLEFINVFDRYGNYLGKLDPLEHAGIAPYLGRKYNHYLMDYIRDEYGVPKESYGKMKERISYDYERLRDIYTQSIGYVPGLHVLMHSNTGSFGNNDRVSAINEYWIKKLFAVNVNREGFSFNKRNSSVYDLTRMQPQAYWYTNHLLMRIKCDIDQEVAFTAGDVSRQKAWETLKGALEIQEDRIILTSLPQDKGLVRLKNSNDFGDVKLSVRLKGNKLGLQKIYLRADESFNRFVSVYLLNNVLYITEKNGGTERELFTLNLDKHDGKERLSVPQDKKAAEIRELETFIQYADSVEKAKVYAERLKHKRLEPVSGLADGAEEYVPALSIHAQGDRLLVLSLRGNKLNVAIDGKDAVTDLPVSDTQAGTVYLETAWGGSGWSQRNLADDVYDGVFEKLIITENAGTEKEKVLFDGRVQGWEAVKLKVERSWEALINWFIVTL